MKNMRFQLPLLAFSLLLFGSALIASRKRNEPASRPHARVKDRRLSDPAPLRWDDSGNPLAMSDREDSRIPWIGSGKSRPTGASDEEPSPIPRLEELPEYVRAALAAKAPSEGSNRLRSSGGSAPDGSKGAEANVAGENGHVCPPELIKLSSPNEVGSLPYSAHVDDRGNAVVTVPLEVPPGPRGMQPRLALTYNSGGGNGPAGLGWTLAGLSAISRVPKTWAADGILEPVHMDDSDRFALDGNLLVPIGNGQYRTRTETFAKIEALDPGFKAWMADGLIREYGTTDDSRIGYLGNGAARRYHTFALYVGWNVMLVLSTVWF